MNALKQSTYSFLILITLACSGWYFASNKTTTMKLDDHTLSTTPDTIITKLTLLQFDTNGRVSHYLQTPLMHHIPLNNTHYLTTPHIKVSQDKQTPWEIHAKEATAIQGGQQITFNKKVIIHQERNQRDQETIVTTEEMTYFPQKHLATTLKPVRFSQAGNVITSTGMNAYLAENRVQLLSNARAFYASNHG
jgi:lipopolysaccharide export system protein LptC